MIAFLKGTIEEISEKSIFLDVNGIGYEIYMPTGSASMLPGVGEKIKIHTYLQISENGIGLYGFLSKDELNVFKLLITVNGIGPKGAVGILSALSANELRLAVLSDDDKAIAKAPGIGAKTAKKLILELKVIADVGLVGFPNVGKSTFLSRVTNARPKIANYHFTTLNPNLGVVDLEGTKGFVIADIPGLIEGASEGIGLGHEFLRHIERTKVIIHIVDAAGTEGRDPITDIYAINKELEAYNPDIAKRPQVIAANKIDAIYDAENDPVSAIKAEFEPQGIDVYPISAVSGQGVKELLYRVNQMLEEINEEPTVFAQEYFPEYAKGYSDEPYTVVYDEEEDEYVVEGPRIEKMLGYTNLESEKGFTFFQNFLKDTGILAELEELGIQEGDTVRMYGLSFDYYK